LGKYRISRAKEAIEEVEVLKKAKKYNAAVTRVYYGVFYVIDALSLTDKFSTPKHSQLIGYFNKNHVKQKVIDPNIGKFLNRAYDLRTKSDYGELVNFTEEEVEEYFKEMKFIFSGGKKLLMKKFPNCKF